MTEIQSPKQRSELIAPYRIGAPVNTLSSLALIAATLLLTSCASLPERQLVYPELYGNDEFEFVFPPKFERGKVNRAEQSDIAKQKALEQYELAVQECEEADGNWDSYLHGDSRDSYSNFYRCESKNEPLPPVDSVVPEETGRLPYVIVLTYSRGESEFSSFRRIYPKPKQKSDQNKN
ncbi:MAG: hypothetical protein OXG24_02480 [Gammaproteobacteria bacterium]|nr:hypothetical protein [Gammaproteobacteria bacterium]